VEGEGQRAPMYLYMCTLLPDKEGHMMLSVDRERGKDYQLAEMAN